MGVTFTFKANKSKKKYIKKPDNKLIASMNLLKGEIYKIIPNTEDCYAITNFGRVMSFPRPYTNQFGTISYTPFRILSSNIDRQGYEYVVISVYNKRYTYKVHRLVAISFIDNPDNLPNVNHKDENKLNNNVNNLEWCTTSYNNTYGTRLKRVSETRGTKIDVYKYNKGKYEFLCTENSINVCTKKYNISFKTIMKSINSDETKQPRINYMFKYSSND